MTSDQSEKIKLEINQLLDKGLRDKSDIYSLVVQRLGIPRLTVRRVARDLRQDYINKVNILQSGLDTNDKKTFE